MFLYVGKDDTFDILEIGTQGSLQNVKSFSIGCKRNWGFVRLGRFLFFIRDGALIQTDLQLREIDRHPIPVQSIDTPHQMMAFTHKIFFTESRGNFIGEFNYTDKSFRFHQTRFSEDCWPNSINFIRNKIHVLYHNHGYSMYHTRNEHFTDCYINKKPVGYCAHNIWEMNNRLWTCNSHVGTIQTLEQDCSISVGEFPRGVAQSQDMLFIGVSAKRQTQSLQGIPPTPIEPTQMVGHGCGIAVFSLPSLRPIAFIPVNGFRIYEIRLMGSPDSAHYGEEIPLDIMSALSPL